MRPIDYSFRYGKLARHLIFKLMAKHCCCPKVLPWEKNQNQFFKVLLQSIKMNAKRCEWMEIMKSNPLRFDLILTCFMCSSHYIKENRRKAPSPLSELFWFFLHADPYVIHLLHFYSFSLHWGVNIWSCNRCWIANISKYSSENKGLRLPHHVNLALEIGLMNKQIFRPHLQWRSPFISHSKVNWLQIQNSFCLPY